MDFLEIINNKLSRAEEEFVAGSNNYLNNYGQLLEYIQTLKKIQSMYQTEPSDTESNHTDLVNINDAVNNGVSTITTSLSTISSKLDNLSTISNKLDNLNAISSKLDNLNSKSQLIVDELQTANDYLKTISEK